MASIDLSQFVEHLGGISVIRGGETVRSVGATAASRSVADCRRGRAV